MNSVNFFNSVHIIPKLSKGDFDEDVSEGLTLWERIVNLSESLFSFGSNYVISTKKFRSASFDKVVYYTGAASTGVRCEQVAALIMCLALHTFAAVNGLSAIPLLALSLGLFLIKLEHHTNFFRVKEEAPQDIPESNHSENLSTSSPLFEKLIENCTPIGLQNPSNSCFMNSIVQIIFHIPHLKQLLMKSLAELPEKKHTTQEEIDNKAILEAFADIVKEINKIKKNRPNYKTPWWSSLLSYDSPVVSAAILNRLRSALFRANLLKNGQYSQNDAGEIFLRILDIIGCGVDIRKTISVENVFSNPLPAARESMLTVEIPEEFNSISLEGCIRRYFAVETVSDEPYRFTIGDKEQLFDTSDHQSKIVGPPPEVLNVQLKRFDFKQTLLVKYEDGEEVKSCGPLSANGKKMISKQLLEIESHKINRSVELDPDAVFDLSEFFAPDASQMPVEAKYRLKAACMHEGNSVDRGHYFSLVKIGENWIECNDGRVQPVECFADKIKNGYLFVLERIEAPQCELDMENR